MGAVYCITSKIKIKDEKDFISKGKEFIETYKANFGLEKQAQLGNTTENVRGIIGIVFVDLGGSLFKYMQDGKTVSFSSGFDASYGWERVMIDFFEAVAPTLESGSKLTIEPDSGFDVLMVLEDGTVNLEME